MKTSRLSDNTSISHWIGHLSIEWLTWRPENATRFPRRALKRRGSPRKRGSLATSSLISYLPNGNHPLDITVSTSDCEVSNVFSGNRNGLWIQWSSTGADSYTASESSLPQYNQVDAMALTDLRFPSTTYQVLSAMLHFLGISVLSLCFSHRAGPEDFMSFLMLRAIPWPRLCIILIFIDSWLFLFTSGVMTFGVGLHLNDHICASAIYLCIGFYTTSKMLIYAYLIEKVHVVWSPSTTTKRFKSPMYIVCMLALSLYVVVLALMSFPGNTHFIRSDGVCVIGLKSMSSIPLLSYDLFINVALTVLFLWPLFSFRTVLNPTIRRVAVRTLAAATVALTTSFVNILILTLLNNKELGWVCLGSCGIDVIINALAIFWVTGIRSNSPHAHDPQDLPKVDVGENRNTTLLSVSQEDVSTAVPKKPILVPQESPIPSLPPPILAVKSKSPSMFARLFRRRETEHRTPSIQVMVTTEYEMDDQTLAYGEVASNHHDAPFRENAL